jgi:hypothetical protein
MHDKTTIVVFFMAKLNTRGFDPFCFISGYGSKSICFSRLKRNTFPETFRVYEKINLQFWELRRPDGKARKLKEYQAYFEFS